jgi:hypothetical protein
MLRVSICNLFTTSNQSYNLQSMEFFRNYSAVSKYYYDDELSYSDYILFSIKFIKYLNLVYHFI